jgi:hypothetical protein
MLKLHEKTCEWSRQSARAYYGSEEAPTHTLAYIHLIFAYGLGRLGETGASTELMDTGARALKGEDPVHRLLFQAFGFRIKAAQEVKTNSGTLPVEIVEGINALPPIDAYVINQLRRHLLILEPDLKLQPYQRWAVAQDALGKKLLEIVLLTDRAAMIERFQAMLKDLPARNQKSIPDRIGVLRACLDSAPLLGEAFGLNALAQLLAAWDASAAHVEDKDLDQRIGVMISALFTAAHFGSKDNVQSLVARLLELLKHHREAVLKLQDVDRMFGESLRGLRKLGMRQEIDALLRGMAEAILGGHDMSFLATIQPDDKGTKMLRSLLHLAAGWLHFDRKQEAERIIAAARTVLFSEISLPYQVSHIFKLARVYIQTLGGVPIEVLKERLEELFERLPKLRDSRTTGRHFTLSHLDVAEAVVLAITGDDSSITGDARRWLDDDEFIVRRRVHRDFQAARGEG